MDLILMCKSFFILLCIKSNKFVSGPDDDSKTTEIFQPLFKQIDDINGLSFVLQKNSVSVNYENNKIIKKNKKKLRTQSTEKKKDKPKPPLNWKHPVPNPYPFKCKTCSKGFRKEKKLKKHQQYHKNRKKCIYCHRDFSSKKKLKEHLIWKHQKPDFEDSLTYISGYPPKIKRNDLKNAASQLIKNIKKEYFKINEI